MDAICMTVIKGTDDDYYQALLKIAASQPAKELGLNNLIFRPASGTDPITTGIAKVPKNKELDSMLKAHAKTFKTIRLEGPNNFTVTFVRTDDFRNGDSGGIHDNVRVEPGKEFPVERGETLNLLIAEVQKATRSITVHDLGPIFGPDVQRHYAAREEALTRLETLTADLMHRIEEQRRKSYEEIQAKERQLTSEFNEKEAHLRGEHENRLAQLNQREEELEQRKKKLDDRSSTHVRRELRQKLKEILADRQESFALSPDTRTRRLHVLLTYCLLLAFFGCFAGYFTVIEGLGTRSDFVHLTRLSASYLGFVVTCGFFLRWLNKWAQQHADEEFRLKQLEVDIDRASWVVEMAFEWKSVKDEDIPSHLINRLSANLFGSQNEVVDSSVTAGDAVATALLNSAGRAKLVFPGGEVELVSVETS